METVKYKIKTEFSENDTCAQKFSRLWFKMWEELAKSQNTKVEALKFL